MTHITPDWVDRMSPLRWYRSPVIARPDLQPTPVGTRYLLDNDPARDRALNPARTVKEHLRRLSGREPLSPWHGRAGFSAITEAWNGVAYASCFGPSGSMIVFGGGHDDYFG